MSKPVVPEAPDTARLRLTMADFHALHIALDKVRSTSTTVTVSKDALRSLLMDHSACLGALRGRYQQD
jgi:hypothetical protein